MMKGIRQRTHLGIRKHHRDTITQLHTPNVYICAFLWIVPIEKQQKREQ